MRIALFNYGQNRVLRTNSAAVDLRPDASILEERSAYLRELWRNHAALTESVARVYEHYWSSLRIPAPGEVFSICREEVIPDIAYHQEDPQPLCSTLLSILISLHHCHLPFLLHAIAVRMVSVVQ